LDVLLRAESVVTDGLEAGDLAGQVRDGWQVSFEQYVAVLGPVALGPAGAVGRAPSVLAVDLKGVPSEGFKLWSMQDLTPGRHSFSFELGVADSETERHRSVASGDFEQLSDAGATYLIRGALAQSGGRSCPPRELARPGDREAVETLASGDLCYDASQVRFSLVVSAPVRAEDCQTDGIPGAVVTAGQVNTVSITLHGDHLFFGGFAAGDEGSVERWAQWLADCDLDLDGEVSSPELAQVPWTSLPSVSAARFPLGSAPVRIATALDYVRAQLMTQGHFEGEGECSLAPGPLGAGGAGGDNAL
jgi:hypothetical protein